MLHHDLLATAIDSLVTAVARQWSCAVATVASFPEPAAPEPDRALRLLRLLVETLAGFAVGGALGPATSRRELGGAHATVRRELLRPHDTSASPIAVVRFLGDADQRPLVDELGARLHVRLIAALPELRGRLAATGATLLAVAPDRIARFAQRLDQLCHDELATLRLTEQLALGWTTYRAALGDTLTPTTTAPWATWLDLARGLRTVTSPPPLAGAILRVA